MSFGRGSTGDDKSVFDVRITAEWVLERLSPVNKRMVHKQEVKLQDIQVNQMLPNRYGPSSPTSGCFFYKIHT